MTPETVLEYLKVIGEYLSPAYLVVRQYVIILAVKAIAIRLITLPMLCGPLTWLAFWLRRKRKEDPKSYHDIGGDWYPFVMVVSIVVNVSIALAFLDSIATYVITLIAPDIPTVIWLIQQVK